MGGMDPFHGGDQALHSNIKEKKKFLRAAFQQVSCLSGNWAHRFHTSIRRASVDCGVVQPKKKGPNSAANTAILTGCKLLRMQGKRTAKHFVIVFFFLSLYMQSAFILVKSRLAKTTKKNPPKKSHADCFLAGCASLVHGQPQASFLRDACPADWLEVNRACHVFCDSHVSLFPFPPLPGCGTVRSDVGCTPYPPMSLWGRYLGQTYLAFTWGAWDIWLVWLVS